MESCETTENPSEKIKDNGVTSHSGLLRLFQSPLFDMELAIQYLSKCNEHGVQIYLVNKFFSYEDASVDFFLPQLVCLFVVCPSLCDALKAYFEYRCRNSIEYTMLLVWLLDSYVVSVHENGQLPPPVVCQHQDKAQLPSRHFSLVTLDNHHHGDLCPPGRSDHVTAFRNALINNNCISSLPTRLQTGPSHHGLLLPTDEDDSIDLTDAACNSRRSGNDSHIQSGTSFTNKIYSIDDFSQLYRAHKRSASDLPIAEKDRTDTLSFRHMNLNHPQSSLRKGFFISDDDSVNEGLDDAGTAHLQLPTMVDTRSSSASVNSLPDLLSGHAFDNVCVSCHPPPSQALLAGVVPETVGSSLVGGCSSQTVIGKRLAQSLCLTNRSTQSLPLVHKSANETSAAVATVRGGMAETTNGDCCSHSDEQHSPPDLARERFREALAVKIPCSCMNYFVEPQFNFIRTLVSISKRLTRFASKEQKTNYLRADLAHLNLNLPARVWIPIYSANHYVVRIPPNAAVCLNSKTRAPYLIYVEVITSSNPFLEVLVQKSQNPVCHEVGSSCSSLTEIDCSNPSFLVKTLMMDVVEGSSHSTDSDVFIAAGDIRRRLTDEVSENQKKEVSNVNDDPSASVLFEPWSLKRQRIRDSSPYGGLDTWDLLPVIVKHGDDLRQEQLAYQVLSMLQKIWHQERVPLWLRPLHIVVLSPESGMIEPVLDAVSVHQIKRIHAGKTLVDYFRAQFGLVTSEAYLCAQRNFVRSLAAYSLVCYLLQVKDRHNGNILLDNEGHMIHIDYGFILSSSPGRNLGFEFSPFKLTFEEVEVMGGLQSDMFEYFKILILQGLLAARKHMDKILSLFEMLESVSQKFPCFNKGFETVHSGLRDRFHLTKTEPQLQLLVNGMVESSLHSLTTKLYDSYQYYTNGIR